MAFQIIDDVLDFTGEQDTVGKPVANDLRQGLITLPAIYYHEIHPDDPDLNLVLNGIYFDESRLARLTAAILSSDAIQKAVAEAEKLANQAVDALQDLPRTVEQQALEELANYIVNRHR
jgi:geranylgeranyl pyrophosphate synthase